MKMLMDRKYVIRRRVVFAVVVMAISALFTYATRDTCYVGEGGNAFGYGSCSKMIDDVIGANK
jgi:hypothetical protein